MTAPSLMRVVTSTHWAELRRDALRRAGDRCEGMVFVFDKAGRVVPGRGGFGVAEVRCEAVWGLQLHHLHYDTLGVESLSDVLVLCDRCHQVATVLGQVCDVCGGPTCGDPADAWRFVAERARERALSVRPERIIDLARCWFGRRCPACEHCGGLDWDPDA